MSADGEFRRRQYTHTNTRKQIYKHPVDKIPARGWRETFFFFFLFAIEICIRPRKEEENWPRDAQTKGQGGEKSMGKRQRDRTQQV